MSISIALTIFGISIIRANRTISTDPKQFYTHSRRLTYIMKYTLAVCTALLSMASASAINAHPPIDEELVTRQRSVCGPNHTPVCCELDILGVADFNCNNGMYKMLNSRFSGPSPEFPSAIDLVIAIVDIYTDFVKRPPFLPPQNSKPSALVTERVLSAALCLLVAMLCFALEPK